MTNRIVCDCKQNSIKGGEKLLEGFILPILIYIIKNILFWRRTIDRSNFKPIVHLAPITRSESSNLHLVAVTKAGKRKFVLT